LKVVDNQSTATIVSCLVDFREHHGHIFFYGRIIDAVPTILGPFKPGMNRKNPRFELYGTITRLATEPIWGLPSGWLEILECAPLKISGSISSLVPISEGKSKAMA